MDTTLQGPRFTLTLFRFLLPAALVFAAAVPVMDSLSQSDVFRALDRVPSAVSLSPDAPPVIAVDARAGHFARTQAFWMSFPRVCLLGTEVNDLQRERCKGLWSKGSILSAIALVPFLLAFVFVLFGRAAVSGFYSRVQKTARKKGPLFAGRVTHPARAPAGSFGFFFGLKCVSVEIPAQRRQVRVFIPESAPTPLPGQTLSVFDGGKAWGGQRLVGTLYAPHMSVVSG